MLYFRGRLAERTMTIFALQDAGSTDVENVDACRGRKKRGRIN